MEYDRICPHAAENTSGKCYVTDCSYCLPSKKNTQIYFNEEWNMEENFDQWYSKIIFHSDDAQLPNGTKISKDKYITSRGFDIKSFNRRLVEIYNEEHKNQVQAS
jgi:hypothetical protein